MIFFSLMFFSLCTNYTIPPLTHLQILIQSHSFPWDYYRPIKIKLKLKPKSQPSYLQHLCNFSQQKKNEKRKVEREIESAQYIYTDIYT